MSAASSLGIHPTTALATVTARRYPRSRNWACRSFTEKGTARHAHVGPNFTDEQFHNTGVAWRNGQLTDEGRFEISNNPRDHGAFKTPTLREIVRTAPYMHDGSIATLEEVIDFYSDAGRPNPNLDSEIRPRNFTTEEKRALLAFLRSFNGRVSASHR